MAFKEVAGQGDVTIKLGGKDTKTGKANPTSVEGYYLGSRTVNVNGGDTLIHQFQTSKGNVDVWGKTDLDRKLISISPGTMVRASFTGTRPIPGKPQPMYTFKVEADDSNTLESAGETEPTGLDEEESDVNDMQYLDEAPAYVPPKKASAAPSLATQKAKDLLAKRS